MAQVTSITSESLQAKIRELLPSQQGFGEDLQASNVILPIIDLTATAEGAGGSALNVSLQQAVAFGSQTSFNVSNTTTTIINTPGFYRIFGVANVLSSSSGVRETSFNLTDGFSTKKIWELSNVIGSSTVMMFQQFDFIAFLAAGQSMSVIATVNTANTGSTRQVATVDGTLVNPSGF